MVELRRHFQLPEDDLEFLEHRGLTWETVVDGGNRWLILQGFPVGRGYNVPRAETALQLPASYPDTQIDMVYFHPHLARSDGRAVPQLSNQNFDGKNWQRWSRHRTAANPWRRDCDCVETHLLLVDEWLRREFQR